LSRLTKRIVDAAPIKRTDYFIWCSELPGFGVRIWPTGKQVFTADYRNADGVRKRMVIGPHGKITAEEARKQAIKILGAVKGDDPAEERATGRKSLTVAALCENYLAAAERGLIVGKRGLPKKAGTIYTDRGRIMRHIVPLLGNKRVRDLAQADINKFIRDVTDGKTAVVEKTTNKRGKAVVEGGSGTAARTAGLLGGILNFAVSEGIIETNPARGVRRPAGQRRKRRLNADDYKALGKALAAADARHEPWQLIAVVKLLALTGARLGEIVNLKWSEVDQEQQCLRLADSKEGASIRPLGAPAIKLLAALGKTDAFVFPAVRRGQGAFGGMAGGWRRLMQGAGVTPHTLRHSFASVADDLGLTMATTGALLGHSAGSVTHRYVHKLDAALIAAADSVATAIHKDMSEGEAHVAQGIRLLEAYVAERPLPAAADARDGRRREPDEWLLWDMAIRRANEPGLSHREAAKLTVDDYIKLHGKIHSPDAAVDRLRKKYAEHAELLASVTNEANWVKTRRAS